MKVLLTGATGFIGSHTAEALIAKQHQVRCLVRSTADVSFLKTLGSALELYEGTLTDSADLQAAVDGMDAVIHCAGLVKVKKKDEFFTTNTEGTRALLKAVRMAAPDLQRFVLVSSLAACGAALNNKIPPAADFNPQPVSQYGQSKLNAEIIAQEFSSHLPITIIRPSVVYGPRDLSTLTFFKTIHRGFLPLSQGGMGAASTIYVTDVANALVQSITTAPQSGSAYFLEDGETLTWRERYYQLAEHAKITRKIEIHLPQLVIKTIAWLSEYYGRLTNKPVLLNRDKFNELKQLYWVCDSTPAFDGLLWRPQINWSQGTQLTYEWYAKSGWL
ncbi:MAG TPA: NAD-dependent epimerase/dehydratase family protein [Gammaproteobacteria bacterium]|nr:NAD-dependent epimerase/dehydratase family protein [Gammaproteobacteria bacterium]